MIMEHMTDEVKKIAHALLALIDGVRWTVTHIGIERYVENGPQWVRLEVALGEQRHKYLIARKEMVKAWIALDHRGESIVEGMQTFVDDHEWIPVETKIVQIDGVRCVQLTLQTLDAVICQTIVMDHHGLVAAYYALRTGIELLSDAQEAMGYLTNY
jgi:hypothetical protein